MQYRREADGKVTHLAIAQMAVKSGDQTAALKAYGNAREYSTSPNHQLEQGLGVLEVSSSIQVLRKVDELTIRPA